VTNEKNWERDYKITDIFGLYYRLDISYSINLSKL
jgi:hypothetical protein